MMEQGQERRQRLYRLSGIVLRRRDLGEADRLLTVFTRDRGKVTLLAKGVRRAASRKAGHLEPFTHTDLLVAKGASLDLVTQGICRIAAMRVTLILSAGFAIPILRIGQGSCAQVAQLTVAMRFFQSFFAGF
jgi:hypothetical protein